MAFQVSSDESFAEPWKGRSTPTTSVVPLPVLLVLPPPHPAAATATTASTLSALLRLFILFLSLLHEPDSVGRPVPLWTVSVGSWPSPSTRGRGRRIGPPVADWPVPRATDRSATQCFGRTGEARASDTTGTSPPCGSVQPTAQRVALAASWG